MQTIFLGKTLHTPLVLASGVLGNNKAILERVWESGCGLPTMKSIGPAPREGHKNPTVIDLGNGMINAVGLPSPGYLNMEEEWQELSDRAFPINASIYGGSVDEFVRVAEFVSAKGPDFIELNISCPNSDKHGRFFGVNAQSSHDVVAAVKKVIHVPLIAKLTPAAPDIAAIAKACEDAGADAICAINTAGPGIVITSYSIHYTKLYESLKTTLLPLKRAWRFCADFQIGLPWSAGKAAWKASGSWTVP